MLALNSGHTTGKIGGPEPISTFSHELALYPLCGITALLRHVVLTRLPRSTPLSGSVFIRLATVPRATLLMPVVRRRGNSPPATDWPDPVFAIQFFQKRHDFFEWRSGSAGAKYAEAWRRMSLLRRSARSSRPCLSGPLLMTSSV